MQKGRRGRRRLPGKGEVLYGHFALWQSGRRQKDEKIWMYGETDAGGNRLPRMGRCALGDRRDWNDGRRGGMARPQKIGLDYFPFDVDFFADRKIKVLFARFGCEGVAFYLYILCEIYRDKGFFVNCDDEFLEVASVELQIERETLLRLLDFMVERQLIHGGLLQEKGVLTSRGIQARYQRAKENAGRKTPVPVRKELWLISGRETSAFIQVRGEEAPTGETKSRAAGKNAAKMRALEREKIQREDLPVAIEQVVVEVGVLTHGDLRNGAKAGERPEEGCKKPGAGGLRKAAELEDGRKEVLEANTADQLLCVSGEAVGLAGSSPDVSEAARSGRGIAGGVQKGLLCEEVSVEGGRCLCVENSGGKNPQRKQNKSKRKERGEGAQIASAGRTCESAPLSFGSEAAETLEEGADGRTPVDCAGRTCESAPLSFGSGAAETLEEGVDGKGQADCAGRTCESAPLSFGSEAAETLEEGADGRGQADCAGNGSVGIPLEAHSKAGVEGRSVVRLVREAFASVPKNFREEIEGFLREGAPEGLVRYAVDEARRLGKPYSYMAAIVRQRLAEGRLDTVYGRRAQPSYDLEEFEKLGFHVPKVPKGDGEKTDGTV